MAANAVPRAVVEGAIEMGSHNERPRGITLREHTAFIRNQLKIIFGVLKEMKQQSPTLRVRLGEVFDCLSEALESTDLIQTLYTH